MATGVSADRRARVSADGPTARGAKTRAAIIAAARRVFERVGFLDARVGDIVAEAGVAHGTFYTYFSTKTDVFKAVIEEVSAEINSAVGHHPDDVSGETWGNLRRANSRYLEVYRRNARIYALIEQVATVDPEIQALRVAGRQRHVSRVMTAIVRLQERGLADPAIKPHPMAGALVAMLGSFAYWSTLAPGEYDHDEVDETVSRIWASSIGLKQPET